MKTRGLPGTFAPRYHDELASGRRVALAAAFVSPTQSSAASGVASILLFSVPLKHVDTGGDPFHMLLDGNGHVGQDRRAAGTCYSEEIRKTSDLKAEIGLWSFGPLLLQSNAVFAADIHSEQWAADSIEACREDDHVEIVVADRGLNTTGVIRVIGCVLISTKLTLSRLKISKPVAVDRGRFAAKG